VHWLYYQRFPDEVHGDNARILELWTGIIDDGDNKDNDDNDDDNNDDNPCDPADNCVYLHIFGDKYEVEMLRCSIAPLR
jgi:hypothetical protein